MCAAALLHVILLLSKVCATVVGLCFRLVASNQVSPDGRFRTSSGTVSCLATQKNIILCGHSWPGHARPAQARPGHAISGLQMLNISR